MKRIVMILVLGIGLISCKRHLTSAEFANGVKLKYPKHRVYIMNDYYKYLIIDSLGNSIIVVTGHTIDSEITDSIKFIEIK